MSEVKVPEYLLAENQQSTAENIQLFEAALCGDLRSVERLLAQGAKPNFFYRPEDQKNALHVAAEQDHVDIVEVLLRHGAVVDSLSAADQSTALVLAARSASRKMMEVLLDAGANINHGKIEILVNGLCQSEAISLSPCSFSTFLIYSV